MSFRGILAVAAIGLVCAGSVLADEMPFALTTSGAFSGLPAGAELGFSGGAASGTTVSGASGPLNLGQFDFELPSSNPAIPLSGTFNLSVTFSVPSVIVGGQTGVFSAVLSGIVNKNNGWVSVTFGAPRSFSFSNPQGSGSFAFAVDSLSFAEAGADGSPAYHALLGSISSASFTPVSSTEDPNGVSSVPEPSTVLLLLSGVFGMFVLRRKFSEV